MNMVKALLNSLARDGILDAYIAVAAGLTVISVCAQASQSISSPGLSLEQSFTLVWQAILKSGFLLGVGFALLAQGYLLSIPGRSGILSVRLTGSSSRARYVSCTLLVALLLLIVYLTGIVVTTVFQLKAWRLTEERFFSYAFASLTRLGMFLMFLMTLGIAFELVTGLPGAVGSLSWLLVALELGGSLRDKNILASHMVFSLPQGVLGIRTPVSSLEWFLFASTLLCLSALSIFSAERRDFR
ncbi:MAG: hypothetical protein IMW97_00685 [Firmicutes bacterium]|nr:hypothetical protein [Candidatus Fermentithermobacillaceae bacterium]